MFKGIDPNGGDLGTGTQLYLTDLHEALPKIADALLRMQQVIKDLGFHGHMSYGFRIPKSNCPLELLRKKLINYPLPDDLEWFNTDGRIVFELRSPGGGISTDYAFYLIAK